MRGKNIINEEEVYIILYENINTKCAFVPKMNDLLLCDIYHSSVYNPIALVDQRNLCLRKTRLPSDILMKYFPLFIS